MGVFVLFRSYPTIAEELYGIAVYPAIRVGLDYTLGLVPFPVVYLFPLVLLYLIWRQVRKKMGVTANLKAGLNLLGWLIAGFYLLWGYNYARPDLSERIDLAESVSDEQLFQLGQFSTARLNSLRSAGLLDVKSSNDSWEKELRQAVGREVSHYGYGLYTTCRVRQMAPAGILRKLGITGIYFPFTGEGLVEKSHPIPEKIFVMAHELAHSFGVTDEGEANLIAYLACTRHHSDLVQYAGHLALWEYLLHTFKRKELAIGVALESNLKPLVQSDLARLKAERQKYQEWVPRLGDFVNDSYLKVQGVEAGTDAYQTLPEQVILHKAFVKE